MASGHPPPPPSSAFAVAVRPGGSASGRSARWAAACLPGDGRAVSIAAVHVVPPLSFVPSPTGELVPVARVGREAMEAYTRDRHARVQEALLPFRRLCGRANATVETVVVEGDGAAEALVRYAEESGVRSLVLGSASFRWFRRKPEPIVHRDLKPANILLDKNYVGKIGDAGFAKLISDLVPDWQTEYNDTIIAGTLYYMDPEYQQTGTVRPKSDLFALGAIILQMLTGKRPHGLIVSTEKAIKSGTFSDILDKSQTDWPVAEAEMLAKLGLRCTAMKCRDRPDLESEVLPKLEEILHRITSTVNLRNPKQVYQATSAAL